MKLARTLVSLTVSLGALVAASRTASATVGATSIGAGWCRTTNEPGVVIANDTAQLVWDAYGNLTLSNNQGGGTQTQWGLASPTPLTGSSPAKLCFEGATGRLRILDTAGVEQWSSGTYTAANSGLVLNKCSLRIKHGTAQLWEEHTPDCDRRRYVKPAADVCWPAQATPQHLLWNDEEQTDLVWASGALTLQVAGEVVWTAPKTGAEVCYQGDGNLVIYDGARAPLWDAASGFAGQTMMTLDTCGIGFSSTPNPADMTRRVNASTCKQSSVSGVWCRKASAAGTLVSSWGTRLDWASDGHLKLYDATGVRWQSPNSQNGDSLCLQDDGNVVIYAANGAALWASGVNVGFPTGGPPLYSDTLSLEACTIRRFNGAEHARCMELASRSDTDWASLGADQRFYDLFELAVCVPNNNFTTWQKSTSTCVQGLPGGGFSFMKDMTAGNGSFGAELWIVAAATNASGLDALRSSASNFGGHVAAEVDADVPAGAPPAGYVEALAGAGISATLFGVQNTILDANGYVENLNGPVDSVSVTSLGFTWSSQASGVASPAVSATFFSSESTFLILGIPVTVSAEVTGELGLNVNVAPTSSSIAFTETPYASLDVDASVAVGVSGLSAGVEGTLNLVTISVPFTQSIGWSQGGSYSCRGDLQVSTLAGEVSLYAKAGPFKAEKRIASFDGYSTGTNLFNQSGSF